MTSHAPLPGSAGLHRQDYAVIASLITLPVEVKQEQAERWAGYPVQAADDAYLENVDYGIGVKAEGYTTAAEIWEAVRDKPGYAVMDRLAVPSRTTTSYRDRRTRVQPAGRLPRGRDDEADPGGSARSEQRSNLRCDHYWRPRAVGDHRLRPDHLAGDAGEGAEHRAAGRQPTIIRLAEGVDPASTSAALESAFLKNGLESVDLIQELRDALATQLVFQQLLLGFLTVGLVVGVAALGVISTRAVVERRQQIGMLRALGFQREMVSWIFLIESSFVALLGIGLGVGLALIPASQMVTDMAADIPGPYLPGAVDGDHPRVRAGVRHDPADHLAARQCRPRRSCQPRRCATSDRRKLLVLFRSLG